MKFTLYEKRYKIKGQDIFGILVDEHYDQDKKKNIYILEEDNRDKDGVFPLHDLWEDEIEEINN